MVDMAGHTIHSIVDTTTLSVVVGGRRADGKVLIFCPSRIGECAISAFETR